MNIKGNKKIILMFGIENQKQPKTIFKKCTLYQLQNKEAAQIKRLFLVNPPRRIYSIYTRTI